MNVGPIHIALVEKDYEIRQLLTRIIDNSSGFTCKLVFGNAESALEEIPYYQPDIVLMDVDLPGMSGISCVKKLKELSHGIKVIMLTFLGDEKSVFNSLKAGASGYLLKETLPTELLLGIRKVHEGGTTLSPHITRCIQHLHQND